MAESKIKGFTKVTYSSDTAVTISAHSDTNVNINELIPSGMVPLFATGKRNGSAANSFIIGVPFLDSSGWRMKFINYTSGSISIKPYADIYCI